MTALYRFFSCCPALIALVFILLPSPAHPRSSDIEQKKQIAEALQQQTEATMLASQILEMISASRYEAAEGQLTELLNSKRMAVDGHRLLEKVYFQLAVSGNEKTWNRWCKDRPASHFPFTVRGMHFYEKARFLDGANRTLLLSEKQRHQFNRFLNNAQVDLEKAYSLNQHDPGPAATLTALALHLKRPRSDMERWFERGVETDPAWLSSYRAKLLYLAPWWYGSDQKMDQFAIQCFNNEWSGSNSYIVALDYLKLKADRLGQGLQGDRFLYKPTLYSMLTTGIDRYLQEYPNSHRIEMYRTLKQRTLKQPYVAVAAFTETLQGNPENIEARKGRISAYLANRQFDKAEDDIRFLEKLEGETAFSQISLGTISFLFKHDLDTGHGFYDKAIGAENSSYRRKHYLLQRGEFYQRVSRHLQAVDDFSAALREDILFEEAHLGRAKSRYELNDVDGALADLVIIKSSIRGRLTTRARSLINTYLQPKAPKNSTLQSTLQSGKDYFTGRENQQTPSSDRAETIQKESDRGHREYLVRGLQYFYREDFNRARQDFYRVIGSSPTSSKAYFMLGKIAEQNDNDLLKACTFYQQAYFLDANIVDYLLAQSRCLYRSRKFPESIELLSAYINHQDFQTQEPRTSAQIYLIRGICLEEMGLIPEALEDMQQAYLLDPELKAAQLFIKDQDAESTAVKADVNQIEIGQLAQINGENNQAISPDIANWIRYSDYSLHGLIEKGEQQLAEGDVDRAQISFLKAIRTSPQNSEPYHHLGRLYFQHKQDYTRAMLYYSLAIDRDPSSVQYFYDRAAINYYYRRYDLARKDFNTVLKLQPGNSQGLYYRGVCNQMLGQIEAALTDFETLRQSDNGWDIEIERFRNAWNAEIDQFLQSAQ